MRDFIWVEKYRPKTVGEAILPQSIKNTFTEFLSQGDVPNLILSGRAGVGKTTVARGVLEELGYDYIIINGSLNGNIDTLRTDITNFASTRSMDGSRRYVILDEGDFLNPNTTQPSLRSFMEQYHANCGFIITCNFPNRILDALRSRCSLIDFSIPSEEAPQLAGQMFTRLAEILKKENVTCDKRVLAQHIQATFPDYRRMINDLQRSVVSGAIDPSILGRTKDGDIQKLIGMLKEKDFTSMRSWVVEHSDMDSATLYRKLYDTIPEHVSSKQSVAEGILILAEYDYKEAFVANPEINRVAALVSLMAEMAWK